MLSSTRDAFSLPSSHQRSDSPGGYGGGYGRASYQDASRSESPAFGEHADGLSRPSRANLGVSREGFAGLEIVAYRSELLIVFASIFVTMYG